LTARVLDAFCGAGGATRGYQLRGCHVTGVDIAPQPDYCGDEFVRDDAVAFVLEFGREFDFIHLSPPCQGYSALTVGTNESSGRDAALGYPKLIPEARAAAHSTRRPFVIENVLGSPLRKDVLLCGEMFRLGVIRHRVFELGRWFTRAPVHPRHRGRVSGHRHGRNFAGPYVAVYGDGGGKGSIAHWQQAMEINWTDDRHGIAEAIPPAYTSWLIDRVRACGQL